MACEVLLKTLCNRLANKLKNKCNFVVKNNEDT